jgi:hypothetical protein
MQSRCLYSVRGAFKLMQSDLDPLVTGVGPAAHAQLFPMLCRSLISWVAAGEGGGKGGADATGQVPAAALAPKRLGPTEKERMRTADRIIMSVLQKVCAAAQSAGMLTPLPSSACSVPPEPH